MKGNFYAAEVITWVLCMCRIYFLYGICLRFFKNTVLSIIYCGFGMSLPISTIFYTVLDKVTNLRSNLFECAYRNALPILPL